MINNIFSIFSLDFVRYAFVGGLLISLSCALLGVTLVLKRFSMIGDGLSHVAFGALAIASIIKIEPMLFTLPVVIIAAFLLLRIRENNNIKGDSAIAIISISSLAFGVLFITYFKGANTDVYNYMFGSILSLTKKDIIIIVLLSLSVILMYIINYNKIFCITFDEKFSKSCGLNVEFHNILISVLSAIVIVVGMKMMGSMLISALIIFPALTAMRICKNYRKVVIVSAIISVICFSIGMVLSVILNTPTGATIVLVNLLSFIIFWIIKKIIAK